MEYIVTWLSGNYFEVVAAGLGFVAIFLQIRQNVWYWLVSIVMVSMYIYIYIKARLYADMSLQVYYLVVSFYGWYMWLFGKKNGDGRQKQLPVSSASVKMRLVLLAITVALFFLIGWFLQRFTNSDLPWWDSFTTALSFVATWMLARKIIENWLIWIIVDAVSVAIYLYKGLYPTAVLFFFLTVLAVVGYRSWRRDLIAGSPNPEA